MWDRECQTSIFSINTERLRQALEQIPNFVDLFRHFLILYILCNFDSTFTHSELQTGVSYNTKVHQN